MSGNKHTPGPWSLLEVNGKLCPVGAGSNLSLLTVVEEDGTDFAAVYDPADARLIAAAPDMLEALRALDMARHTDAPADWVKATKLCDAAIAKAEGSALPLHEGSGE